MSIKKRKIGFYSLKIINTKKSDQEEDPKLLKILISKILDLDRSDRIYDIKNSNKFHLLSSEKFNNNIHNVIFNSAKYHHSPPLISKETADERKNPKLLFEGESEKTHITMRYNHDEIILLHEERKVGIAIGKLIEYFNHYFRSLINDYDNSYVIEFFIIPKGNFYKELNNLKRVRFGNIFISKKVLGSEFLNFADRIETV